MTSFAELEEKKRDLRSQISGLDQGDVMREATIEEFSPGRKLIQLWSMQDGTEITIPRYMVPAALGKRLPGGGFAFTASKDSAPVFKPGNVRCFLAEGSTERESGLLEEAGLGHLPPCPMQELRSNYSKRIHALHRHNQSWMILQEYITATEQDETRSEQRQQTAAMLKLAGGVALGDEAPNEAPRRGRPRKEE